MTPTAAESLFGPSEVDASGVPAAIQAIRRAHGLPPLSSGDAWQVTCRGGCGRVLGDRRATRYPETICRDCLRAEREAAKDGRGTLTVPTSFRWARDWELVRQRVSTSGAPAMAREALASGAALLTLIGPSGSGKTSLACGLIFDRLGRGAPSALYVTARDVARAEPETRLGQTPPLLASAREVSLLVVDELGGEGSRGGDVLRAVLLERHARGAPTILGTWLRVDDLGRRYGEGIGRRVASGAVVRLGAPSVAVPMDEPRETDEEALGW